MSENVLEARRRLLKYLALGPLALPLGGLLRADEPIGSVEDAHAIAQAVRESSGGLPGVQALGLGLGDRVQVSTNLVDIDATPLHRLVDRIVAEAAAHGAQVGGGELVGLLPAKCVLEAARDTGADAIHPGYGFLSENPALARACAEAKIVFIGPPPEAMEAVGDKVAARALMEKAGVPVLPGTAPLSGQVDQATREARRIGYPVLIKAAAG